MVEARGRWLEAALVLDRWLADRGDAGHDPHDLLASPLVRRLTLGSRWGGVFWTQLGKRSPISPRWVLGVPRARNSKGLALALAAQVRLARAVESGGAPAVTIGASSSAGGNGISLGVGGGGGRIGGSEISGVALPGLASEIFPADIAAAARARGRGLADLLYGAGVEAGGGLGWGYPFPWANRDFHAPAGTPSSVVTAFVGHALLDAAEGFGWAEARGYAAEAGEFLRGALNRIPGPAGTFCFSYTPLDRRGVHNANLLAASLLARLGSSSADQTLLDESLLAARFTAAAQAPDGSWPYGITGRNSWVDSFHTGYTLVALAEVGAAIGTGEFDDAVERGLAYWRRSFLVGPAVAFFPGRAYPVDLHAVAHAMVMLARLRELVPDAPEVAGRLADWSLEEMRDPSGYFYYQRHRYWRNRVGYIRWIQAWVLLGLAELVAAF